MLEQEISNFNVIVDIYINEAIPLQTAKYKSLKTNSKTATIIGAGPAGLFAALYAISKGVKPVIIERGKKLETEGGIWLS